MSSSFEARWYLSQVTSHCSCFWVKWQLLSCFEPNDGGLQCFEPTHGSWAWQLLEQHCGLLQLMEPVELTEPDSWWVRWMATVACKPSYPLIPCLDKGGRVKKFPHHLLTAAPSWRILDISCDGERERGFDVFFHDCFSSPGVPYTEFQGASLYPLGNLGSSICIVKIYILSTYVHLVLNVQ